MATDDELLSDLGDALHETPRQPPADRVAALRAAVAARQPSPDRATTAPVSAIASRRASRAGRMATAAMAVAAVAAAFVAGGVLLERDEPTREDLLAGGVLEFESVLRAPEGGATASATGIRTGIGRIVQVRTDELPILPKGEFYEVWFVGPGDSPRSPNRISAGTFHPDDDGRSAIDLTAAVDPARYPSLSVTAEPGDGNPLPTGPEVLRADIELLDT